jgi:glycosyltransferase involved in cell wall biosynthesis
MNICFICKYPPIEGGVSMHGYWAARGLARRGHNVYVVTNANEVEPAFRMHLTAADRAEGGEYARSFPGSGSVKVVSTEPPDSKGMAYIPLNNPTVTRLATIATNLIRSENCEVIFSYYLEPFGLAAHLASSWTGVPYVFQHAGSDLFRLSLLEDLQTAYVEVMKGANRVFSSGSSREVVLSYGVPEERIASGTLFGLPLEYFNPDVPPLDISLLFEELAHSADHKLQSSFEPLDESLPKLGLYGKLGEYKGSFDLLHAMAQLIRDGFPFYLLAMSGGWQISHFSDLVSELGLTKYVRFLPFLPHWRVPSFIRGCTAVTFLERDFPITAHGPTIPSEIIACGKCLVVSEEAARKQKFQMQMRNFKNIVIVPDPKQHDVLASSIRFALEDSQRADEIGRRGFEAFTVARNHHEDYINRMESLLSTVADEKPVVREHTREAVGKREAKGVAESTSIVFPFTRALLSESQWERVKQLIKEVSLEGEVDNEAENSSKLSRKLLTFLDLELDMKSSQIREVCQYECDLLEWKATHARSERTNGTGASFVIGQVGPLFPSIRGHFKVVTFSSDAEANAAAVKDGQPLPRTESKTRILFHSDSVPMKINEQTEHLLEMLVDSAKTTDQVIESLSDCYHCEDEHARSQLREACLSVLEGLYWAGIIEFRAIPNTEGNIAALRAKVAEPGLGVQP